MFRARSVLLLAVLLLAADPLAAGTEREAKLRPARAGISALEILWQRLTAAVATLGPEMDPGGTPSPRQSAEVPPPPAPLGPEADPTG